MRENKVYDFVFDLMYSTIVRNINVTNVSLFQFLSLKEQDIIKATCMKPKFYNCCLSPTVV